MLKYIVKNGENNFVIPLCDNFGLADKDEVIQLSYIPQQIEKELPEQKDYEVVRFNPDTINKIVLQLYNGVIPLYMSDFGFTQTDVKTYSNRIRKSFLRLSFYDTNSKLNRKLLFETDLFIQRSSFYDANNKLLNVSNIPLIFNILNPKIYTNETEGYFLYLRSWNIPNTLYCNFRFNLALDGNSYTYYPKNDVTISNLLEEYEYVTVNINNNIYRYNDTNKTLTYNNDILLIDLYGIN